MELTQLFLTLRSHRRHGRLRVSHDQHRTAGLAWLTTLADCTCTTSTARAASTPLPRPSPRRARATRRRSPKTSRVVRTRARIPAQRPCRECCPLPLPHSSETRSTSTTHTTRQAGRTATAQRTVDPKRTGGSRSTKKRSSCTESCFRYATWSRSSLPGTRSLQVATLVSCWTDLETRATASRTRFTRSRLRRTNCIRSQLRPSSTLSSSRRRRRSVTDHS